MQDPAVGQGHLQGENIVLGCAVLGALDATGVAGHVASQGGDRTAGRVRWEEEAIGLQGFFQIGVYHAGLHHGQAVLDADLNDLVHAPQIKNRAPLLRHGQTGQRSPGAAGSNRELLPVGELEDCRNLLGRGSPHGRLWPVPVFRGVLGVGDHIDQAVGKVLLAHNIHEGCFGFLIHARLPPLSTCGHIIFFLRPPRPGPPPCRLP